MPDHANQPGSSGAPFVASDDDESAAPGGSGSQSKSQRSAKDIRSRSVIDELRKDELAAHILETVDVGPFGRAGREKRSIDPTKDNFFSSIVTDRPKAQSHRSRRESRATRETVIENVISRADSVQLIPPYVSHDGSVPTPGGDEDLTDCADAFGNLSIDENREVRYHGNSSGLHLLVQAERTDGRAIKGIWNFPMAKIWPGPHPLHSAAADPRSSNLEIRLPPEREQRRLLDVYFKYVNPAVPIIDEETFMSQYETMISGYPTSNQSHYSDPPMENDIKPEQPQKLSDLLLFAVFACAASYIDPLERYSASAPLPLATSSGSGRPPGHEREAEGEGRRMSADEYAACARRVLDTMYHESRSSTVQALLLLGVRGFGTGSLEEGWLHVGMAIRMALDLGMNRNPDKWMHNGRELFSIKEQEIRKRIWWSCCIVDKFSALFLGRTIAIHEKDFSTPLLEVPEDDLDQLWRPSHLDPRSHTISPVPGAVTSPDADPDPQYYNRLLQWALDLPEHLNYSATSTRPCPAPHILAMHIQYWASVVLLHRPFIPKGTELARADSPSLDPDPIPWESYDICQSAATQIASLATVYHETYDIRWAPPFLANCLQTAGIMHVLTLKYKPLDAQASASLQKCINALAGMEVTWAMALRVRHLIQNAKVNIDQSHAAAAGSSSAPASVPAQVYAPLPPQRSSAPPMRPTYPAQSYVVPSQPAHTQPQAYTSSQMAYVPQSDVARGVPSYAGYAPGYDTWWSPADAQANVVQSDPVRSQNVGLAMHARAPQAPVQVSAPPDGTGVAVPGNAGVAQRLPSQEFTFGQEHFTPEFLQAMRDPVLHFPSVFAPQR
ncbi:hypothetical protein ACG7TL_004333 [Trametes sanguinea]